VGVLEQALRTQGCDLFVDHRKETNIQQAQILVDWIRRADHVVAVISEESSDSETLEFQLETVSAERRKQGKPSLITVRVNADRPVVGPVGSYVLDEQMIVWNHPSDDNQVVGKVMAGISGTAPVVSAPSLSEPAGAIRPSTRFYTLRKSDADLDSALWAAESVILIRGPRQIGKTSLIGRGAELANALNWRTVSTDFQKLNAFQLTDVDKFCLLLAKTMARQLEVEYDFEAHWVDDFGPNLNLDHFVKTVLRKSEQPLVWFMDEADRIFTAPFASDFYGLVRSWHNARATDPGGPWSRFTVVIGYATEARLFIQDLNQSPFNVGKQISLESFSLHQTTDLNVRYGEPLKRKSDLEGLQFLLGGQPMLTRRALELLASGVMDYASLIESAERDDGPFADHLKRVLFAVSQAPDVLSTLRSSLAFVPVSDSDAVQRLIAAGILRETSDGNATVACDLYAQYLARHLSAR
jgi:hypothetical protein